MTPREHARQSTPGIRSANNFSEPAQWKFILYSVFEPAAAFGFWNKQVCVLPGAKRSRHHDVAKHAPWLIFRVLRGPGLLQRTNAQLNLHPRPGLLDAATAFYDTRILPGRRESRQRVRPGMPGVNGLGGGRH